MSPQKPSALLRLLRSLSSFRVWVLAKLSSNKIALVAYYKAKTQRKKPEYSNKKHHEEKEHRNSTPLAIDYLHHPNGKIEQQYRTDEKKNSETNMKPSFPIRLLRFFWKRRKSFLSKEAIEILLAAAIALATWAQVKVYTEQSRIMKEQAQQTERSVILGIGQLNAARAALKSSQQAFQIDQRPYLVVDENFPSFYQHGPIPEQKIEVNVRFKNLGKTPAIKVLSNVRLFKFRAKLKTDLKTKKQFEQATEEYIQTLESKFADMRKHDEAGRNRIAELERRNIAPGQDIAPQKTYFFYYPRGNDCLSRRTQVA